MEKISAIILATHTQLVAIILAPQLHVVSMVFSLLEPSLRVERPFSRSWQISRTLVLWIRNSAGRILLRKRDGGVFLLKAIYVFLSIVFLNGDVFVFKLFGLFCFPMF